MFTRIKLILATLAAAASLASRPGEATPAVPTGVFDPSETGWQSYRNLTSAQFAAQFAALKPKYMVIDLDVDVIDGDYRVGAVFRANPDGRGWASLRNLTDDEFHERWTTIATPGSGSSTRRPTSTTATGCTPACGSRTASTSAGRRTAA